MYRSRFEIVSSVIGLLALSVAGSTFLARYNQSREGGRVQRKLVAGGLGGRNQPPRS